MLGVALTHLRWWLGVWRVPCPCIWVANSSNLSHFIANEGQVRGFSKPTSLLYCREPTPRLLYIFPRTYRTPMFPGHSILEGIFLSKEAEFWEAQLLSLLKWEESHFTVKNIAHWLGAMESIAEMSLCAPDITFLCCISVSHTYSSPPVVFLSMALDPLTLSLPLLLLYSYLCRNVWSFCWFLCAREILGQTPVLTPWAYQSPHS